MFWTPGTGYDSVQYMNLLLVYTVKSWNKLFTQCHHKKAEIVKFILLQGKTGALLEADSSTGSCTGDNRRSVLATRRCHTARSCSWGIVLSGGGWYSHSRSCLVHARESRAWSTAMTLMFLSYWLLAPIGVNSITDFFGKGRWKAV